MGGERFTQWVEDCLGAVMAHPACTEYIGETTPMAVLKRNQGLREECDEDLDEARVFMSGIVERLRIFLYVVIGVCILDQPIGTSPLPH